MDMTLICNFSIAKKRMTLKNRVRFGLYVNEYVKDKAVHEEKETRKTVLAVAVAVAVCRTSLFVSNAKGKGKIYFAW